MFRRGKTIFQNDPQEVEHCPRNEEAHLRTTDLKPNIMGIMIFISFELN